MPGPRRDVSRILQRRRDGDIQGAAQGVADLQDAPITRCVLTAILMGREGREDVVKEVLRPVSGSQVERFIATYFANLTANDLSVLGPHVGVTGDDRPAAGERPIVLFPFPKSGSTFLEKILQAYTGLPSFNLSPGAEPSAVGYD